MIASEKVSVESESTQGGESSSEMEFVVQKRIIKEVMVRIEMGNTLKNVYLGQSTSSRITNRWNQTIQYQIHF